MRAARNFLDGAQVQQVLANLLFNPGQVISSIPNVLRRSLIIRSYTAVVERDTETGLLVGLIPGFRGAHSQGESMEELETNLAEVIAMLLEDGEPR